MKKSLWITVILILIVLIGLWAFLSLGRAGGEIGFGAEVIRIEDGVAYAMVTEDHAGFGSRRLPDTVVIYTTDFPEHDIQVGDSISGIYIRKRYEGNFYRVVSVIVNGA